MRKKLFQRITTYYTSIAHRGSNIWRKIAKCLYIQSCKRVQEMRFHNGFKRNEIQPANFKYLGGITVDDAGDQTKIRDWP